MLVVFHRHRVQALALLVCAALSATLVVAPGRSATATAPPNPTNGQISKAQQQKAALANQVGQLGAQVAQMQSQLRQLVAAQEMAEQKLAYALSLLAQAKIQSATAAQGVRQAQNRVAAAKLQFQSYVQASYMSGSLDGTTASLLTADNPNIVLQQSALQAYESDHQLNALGNLNAATVAQSNADAKARYAVQQQKRATTAATVAKHNSDIAVVAAQARKQQLSATLAADQSSLQRAQEQLATLNHQRAQYLAYQKKQAEIRAAELKKKLAEEAAAHAAYLREQKREAEAAARQRAIDARKHSGTGGSGGSGSGGSGSGGGGSSSPAPIASGGSWTAARGREAVRRAERYLGWMYAWAGGNASGPTYGVCAGDGAFNDCHVKGFDCSGLTLYGWAPYEYLAHYTVLQYSEAGSYHPSLSNLEPGDLLFWSSNGSASGIHHVAMYIGHDYVIQAPQSGEVIQETPVDQVDWGYFGATRPLT